MGRRGLLAWIIVFKGVKAALLTALGVALLTTLDSDPTTLVLRLALSLHLPLTAPVVGRVLAFVSRLTVSKQAALAVTAFGYAALMGTEGVALYLRKPWARWLTIGATASLIPIEIYEIVRGVNATRVAALVVNIAVVVYLWRRKDLSES